MHNIRPYTPADAEQLADIWLAATVPAHPFIPEEYWRRNRQRMANDHLPHSETYIIENGSTAPCGFISLLGRHIAALFIHPNSQGQGYGSALLRHAQQKHRELTLRVYAANTDSVHFYEYHGFNITTRTEDTATGAPELHMHWLSPPLLPR